MNIQPNFKEVLRTGFLGILVGLRVDGVESEDLEKVNKCIQYLEIEYNNSSQLLIKEEEYKYWCKIYIEHINKNLLNMLNDHLKIPEL